MSVLKRNRSESHLEFYHTASKIRSELTRFVHIVKLRHGMRFLKVLMTLTCTGRVTRRMARDSIVRQRRKLRKFAAKVSIGHMTIAEVANSYASWKGHAIRRGGTMAARQMDRYFKALFGVVAPVCRIKKRRKRTWTIRKAK